MAEELESQGFFRQELRVVGSLRIDRYRAYRRDFLASMDSLAPKRVLVTTQGLDIERLIAFMKEVLQLAQDDASFEVIFKLHPMRERSKTVYEAAFAGDPRVTVLLGSEDPPTFALLANADVHVSISSACHYDALGLGVMTVILPLFGADTVLDLCRQGHARLLSLHEICLKLSPDAERPACRRASGIIISKRSFA